MDERDVFIYKNRNGISSQNQPIGIPDLICGLVLLHKHRGSGYFR